MSKKLIKKDWNKWIGRDDVIMVHRRKHRSIWFRRKENWSDAIFFKLMDDPRRQRRPNRESWCGSFITDSLNFGYSNHEISSDPYGLVRYLKYRDYIFVKICQDCENNFRNK